MIACLPVTVSPQNEQSPTDCLWVIRCHSHEFTGYFEGEGRVTLL